MRLIGASKNKVKHILGASELIGCVLACLGASDKKCLIGASELGASELKKKKKKCVSSSSFEKCVFALCVLNEILSSRLKIPMCFCCKKNRN